MNIVIVGLGKFGKELTKHLSKEDHTIIVIDKNPSVVDEVVNEFDCLGYAGNGVSYRALEKASVFNYDLLIAVTSSDESNILSCLIAKKLGIKHTIARVRNPEYDYESTIMTDGLGINLTLNPDLDTAKEIFRILRFPSAVKVDSFGNGKVDIVEFKVSNNNLLVNKKLSVVQENNNVRFLVCAVKRGDEVFIPKGDFVIKENDDIYLTASQRELERVFKKFNIESLSFS